MLLWVHLRFTSHTEYIVAAALLVFPFAFPWDFHGFSTSRGAADQLNRAADQLLKGLYCVVLSFTDDVK